MRLAHGHKLLVLGALLALLVAIGAGSTARAASSGGVGEGAGGAGASGGSGIAEPAPDPEPAGCPNEQLGRRTLRVGDCGGDVATLNWILKAKRFGRPALADRFEAETESAVEAFESAAGLLQDGIVDSETAKALVSTMRRQLATWYGPGFFGNRTACGQVLTERTRGVAHRTLPCGSRVVIRYRGRFVRTTVIDRGPYANGAKWDLTQATARSLRFEGMGDVRVAKIPAGTP